MNILLNLQRGETNLELCIEYQSYNGRGDDDPSEIEILSASTEDGAFIELSDEEKKDFEQQITQHLHEQRNDKYEYNSDQ